MPALTIIMPTYNGAAFLPKQIDSILAQTAGDFELLVIDDGSTDDSVAIVDGYVGRDPRVRRLPATGNVGQRRRLFELAAAASGAFLAVADQDDVWHPERNARLLAAIEARAVAFGRSRLIDGAGNDLGRSVLEALGIDPLRVGRLGALFLPLVSAHAAIIRREWLDPAAFLGLAPFDQIIGIEALLSEGLVYVDEAVVFHRIHGGNQMNATVADREPGKLLSLTRLRASTDFVRLDRLTLYLLFDQLGKSTAIPLDVRATFARGAAGCRYTWFQRLSFRPGAGRRLERGLCELFERFASSPEDLSFLRDKLRSVTRWQYAPVNIAGAIGRHRGTIG